MIRLSAFADEISQDPVEQVDVLGRHGIKHIEFRAIHGTNVLDLGDAQHDEFRSLLSLWRRKLKEGGTLILADVISPATGPVDDVRALLGFAWQGGFLTAALAGLVRTALSDYRKLRQELGLLARRDE